MSSLVPFPDQKAAPSVALQFENPPELMPCSHRIWSVEDNRYLPEHWEDEEYAYWVGLTQKGQCILYSRRLADGYLHDARLLDRFNYRVEECSDYRDALNKPLFERDVVVIPGHYHVVMFTIRREREGTWQGFPSIPGWQTLSAKRLFSTIRIGTSRDPIDVLLKRALEVTLSGRPTFAEQIRLIRINQKMGLRRFCKQTGQDAGYWSRVERNRVAPPVQTVELLRIKEALQLNELELPYQNLVAAAVNWRPAKPDEPTLYLPLCPAKGGLDASQIERDQAMQRTKHLYESEKEDYEIRLAAYLAHRRYLEALFAPEVCPI